MRKYDIMQPMDDLSNIWYNNKASYDSLEDPNTNSIQTKWPCVYKHCILPPIPVLFATHAKKGIKKTKRITHKMAISMQPNWVARNVPCSDVARRQQVSSFSFQGVSSSTFRSFPLQATHESVCSDKSEDFVQLTHTMGTANGTGECYRIDQRESDLKRGRRSYGFHGANGTNQLIGGKRIERERRGCLGRERMVSLTLWPNRKRRKGWSDREIQKSLIGYLRRLKVHPSNSYLPLLADIPESKQILRLPV